jgi:hypothetical protein
LHPDAAMDLDCPHTSLATYWADADDDRRIVTVRTVDALALSPS